MKSKYGKTALLLCVVLLLTAIIEYFSFGLAGLDWYVPMLYDGDGITGVNAISNALYDRSGLLGWPYHQQANAYTPNYSMMYTVFVWVCRLIFHDVGPAFNLYILIIPLMNVAVCLLVLRSLKVRGWLAVLGSLTFGLCPYVQQRLTEGHMALAGLECIPLVVLLCFWCVEDDRFQRPGKGFFHYRRNWLALLFGWMIANNGMVYYPFFSCFLFCLTGLCLILRTHRLKSLLKPLLCVGEVAIWLVIVFLPVLFIPGSLEGATSGAVRTTAGVELYGLRISSLLLSPNGYGIPALATYFSDFWAELKEMSSLLINESTLGYLGMVGVAGFLGLLGVLFAGRGEKAPAENALPGRFWLLSRLNLGVLLLATVSGFGTVVGIFIPYIRGYNRMSGFIACLSVFAAVLWLDGHLPKGRGLKTIAVAVAVAAVFGYGLWEQQGFFKPDMKSLQAVWAQDEAFVWQIEQHSGEDAMVYQLPYMQSFENGPIQNMADYTLLRGVLHSRTLRWSYGAPKDSENDVWNLATCRMKPAQMVAELKEKGFSGIWMDMDGFTAYDGEALRTTIMAEANCDAPLRSENGKLYYIYFEE